ncbi:MAG: hypothetical protein AB9836_01000 [Aminipila sp.]
MNYIEKIFSMNSVALTLGLTLIYMLILMMLGYKKIIRKELDKHKKIRGRFVAISFLPGMLLVMILWFIKPPEIIFRQEIITALLIGPIAGQGILNNYIKTNIDYFD